MPYLCICLRPEVKLYRNPPDGGGEMLILCGLALWIGYYARTGGLAQAHPPRGGGGEHQTLKPRVGQRWGAEGGGCSPQSIISTAAVLRYKSGPRTLGSFHRTIMSPRFETPFLIHVFLGGGGWDVPNWNPDVGVCFKAFHCPI